MSARSGLYALPLDAAPIVLDATAATACPVKTRHAYERQPCGPGPAAPGSGPDDDDLIRAERERDRAAFTADALSWWIDARTPSADLRRVADPGRRIDSTLALMQSGMQLIVGPGLPPELGGHRGGAPDALLRCDDGTGGPHYLPVIVRWHRVLLRPTPGEEIDSGIRLARLAHPLPREAEETDFRLRLQSRLPDFLQLAHYHRLLRAAGFAGEALGGVIGTDQLPDDPLITWVPLDRPMVRVIDHAAPDGWDLRSLLERADAELSHRVAIAEAVRRPRTHSAAVVSPVVVDECRTCPWWTACRAELDPDDLSLRIGRGRLDRIEVTALRARGISTVAALAVTDVDALLPTYLPDVAHRPDAEPRIRAAARRARMLDRGEPIERETDGRIDLPTAEVEIDLDIETSASGRIYLWGFAVDHGCGPSYVQFSRFAELDDASELALARRALGWLRDQVADAGATLVFHYSGYEVAMISALAARALEDDVLQWAAAYAGSEFVDVLETVQANFFGAVGLGLKQIAATAGFEWRDPDPGGLNSQRWFDQAVHGPDETTRAAARERVLAYNEDDVRATAHLRAWLRAQ